MLWCRSGTGRSTAVCFDRTPSWPRAPARCQLALSTSICAEAYLIALAAGAATPTVIFSPTEPLSYLAGLFRPTSAAARLISATSADAAGARCRLRTPHLSASCRSHRPKAPAVHTSPSKTAHSSVLHTSSRLHIGPSSASPRRIFITLGTAVSVPGRRSDSSPPAPAHCLPHEPAVTARRPAYPVLITPRARRRRPSSPLSTRTPPLCSPTCVLLLSLS